MLKEQFDQVLLIYTLEGVSNVANFVIVSQ